MNRTFHARIAWYQYVLLVILGSNLIGFLWYKYIIPAIFLALLLLVVIEQIIHTAYTVTSDNTLIISRGRFSRKKTIPISDIVTILKCHSMRVAGCSVTNYLRIEYGNNKFASAMPINEQEFVALLHKRSITETNFTMYITHLTALTNTQQL